MECEFLSSLGIFLHSRRHPPPNNERPQTREPLLWFVSRLPYLPRIGIMNKLQSVRVTLIVLCTLGG